MPKLLRLVPMAAPVVLAATMTGAAATGASGVTVRNPRRGLAPPAPMKPLSNMS